MNWLETESGLTSVEACQVLRHHVALKKGVVCGKLTMKAHEVWPGAIVTEYPGLFVLKNPGVPDVNVGVEFSPAFESIQALVHAERYPKKLRGERG